jgi:hypothetical protein
VTSKRSKYWIVAIANQSSGIHCQALWSTYIMLESSIANFVALKTVFFHGITKIPWSKSFVLQGLEVLSSVLDNDELKKIYQLLEQREMRVHSNIWDILNGMGGVKATIR